MKARLMLGAGSALIMSLAATAAHAQAVTIAGAVTTTMDGTLVSDQTATGNVTSASTGAQIKTNEGGGSVSASTLNVDGNRVGASASGNVDTLIFADTGSANSSTGAAAAARQVTKGVAGLDPSNFTYDSNQNATNPSDGSVYTWSSGNQKFYDAANREYTSHYDGTRYVLDAVSSVPVEIKATSSNTFVELRTGAASQSNLSLKNNTDAATAAGNTLAQSLTLDSANLSIGNGNAVGNAASTLKLDGKALTASLQNNNDTLVSAKVESSDAQLTVSGTTDSSLALTGNTQSASATGSSAANGIALTGVNLGTGVASSSVQNNAATNVTASAEGFAGLATLGTLGNSSQALTANRLQSQATGATSANTLSLTGTDATLPSAAIAPAATVQFAPTTLAPSAVTAAYATQNAQNLSDGSDVTATTQGNGGQAAYMNQTSGAGSNSNIATDSNMIFAKAQGAVTSNATTLSLGAALGAGALGSNSTAANVAEGVAIGSLQTVANGSDVSAKVASGFTLGSFSEPSANLIKNYAGASLTNSSLSASNNLVQATAEATNATNALTASATSLSTAGDALGVAQTNASSTGVNADAAFSIANAQRTGTGTVSATIQPTYSGMVENYVQSGVSGSSVMANGNQFAGFAVADKAANTLAVSGTTVTTDTALVNAQSSGADVKADLGAAGQTGGNVGVSTILSGNVSNSSVAVNGNSALGSSVNNSAANTLAVSATSLSGTGTNDRAKIIAGTTEADNSLTNLQSLDSGSSSTTNVYGGFAAVQYQGDVTDSKLSVANNTQFAESLGNSATNRLSSTATDTNAGSAPTAALSNAQDANTVITSGSTLTAKATASSTRSNIAISGNSNTALGVVNNGSNTLTVSGTDIANRGSAAGFASSSELQGDYALANVQGAMGSVTSTANTVLANTEYDPTSNIPANSAKGVKDGSVALNGNATTAEGSGNRVSNQLSVAATATNGASAVLGNSQDNAAGVTTAAQTTVNYRLQPSTQVASADASTVSIDGNSTTALARGNTANNTLNYAAGVRYTGNTDVAQATTGSATGAQADLANVQTNSGAIAATSTSSTYAMVLNAGPNPTQGADTSAALNSSASVSGNSTAALAYGNTAVNSLTMATFAQGVPSSAVSSYQTNSGSVSATATTTGYNASFSGTVANSAVRNTGNSVTAQAVGNSSISSIGG
ncbi:MAG: hypothetical protein CFE35_13730 [Novosphingobium sp. PASSN1]|nr:MAG: hypothetical protein CFE35_13730 [Novosphingobium sp. PASSN1]